MREFQFGIYRTYTDWGCFMQAGWTLDPALPKIKSVDLPAGDGTIDLTEALTGDVKYNDRTLKVVLVFPLVYDRASWNALHRTISNAINGQRLKVLLPDDNAHYMMGRLYEGTYDDSTETALLEIDGTMEPWKYKNDPTVVTTTVKGFASVTLHNENKRAVLTMTTTAQVVMSNGSLSGTFTAGTYTLMDWALGAGDTVITLNSSNATVTFSYQEASL